MAWVELYVFTKKSANEITYVKGKKNTIKKFPKDISEPNLTLR